MLLRRPLILFFAALATTPALAQTGDEAKPLSDAEAASFTAALKAIDEARYADARAMVANFNQPLLIRYIEWSILRAAPRTDATFAATWRFLHKNPRLARTRGPAPPGRGQDRTRYAAGRGWRYFKSFPPLTSAAPCGVSRRPDAVSPGDVARPGGR